MTRRTYTDTEKTEALRLYETDGPSAVERTLGIPKNTVAGWAKTAGVRTVRVAKTEAATQAASVDAAALRQAVASTTIKAAATALEILTRRLNTEADLMPLKDLATVAGILVDKHQVLESITARHDTHEDARTVIGDLVAGLTADHERRHGS